MTVVIGLVGLVGISGLVGMAWAIGMSWGRAQGHEQGWADGYEQALLDQQPAQPTIRLIRKRP